MRFQSRVGFLSVPVWWTVLRSVELPEGERSAVIDGWLAAEKVGDWVDDLGSLPAMLSLYEALCGSFLPDELEVERQVKPTLREAFRRGSLVALREKVEEVITEIPHGPSLEDLVPPKPKKPPQLIKEKTFFDLTVVNKKGTPLAGRRYKIQLPDGKTETGVLPADARIVKSGIDPGTATFSFLPHDGEVFHSDEPPDDPEGDTLIVFLQDGDGQPLANGVYRLRLGDETREGTAGGDGRVEEKGIPSVEECHLEWGPAPDADSHDDAYVYSQRLYLDVEGSDDAATERQLANLGYVEGSLDERLAAFQGDYDGSLADVQQNGTAGKSSDSDSGEAVA